MVIFLPISQSVDEVRLVAFTVVKPSHGKVQKGAPEAVRMSW